MSVARFASLVLGGSERNLNLIARKEQGDDSENWGFGQEEGDFICEFCFLVYFFCLVVLDCFVENTLLAMTEG